MIETGGGRSEDISRGLELVRDLSENDHRTSSSGVPESEPFDFDQYYGSASSENEDSRSARPDSEIRPHSCGFAISEHYGGEEEAHDDIESVKSSDSAWWRRSVLDSEMGSSIASTERDPFENEMNDTSETMEAFDAIRLIDVLENNPSGVEHTEETAEVSAHMLSIPEIQIEDCEDVVVQEVQCPTQHFKPSAEHHHKVTRRSTVVSFAAEDSIIMIDAAESDDEISESGRESQLSLEIPAKPQTRSSLSPQWPIMSRRSMAALPTWASVYYKRGSACLTQLSRRSTIKNGSKHDPDEESESLVEQGSLDENGRSLNRRMTHFTVCDRGITRPPSARTSKAIRKSTFRCSSRISELSWKPELKSAIETPIKNHYEHASFAKAQVCEEDKKMLRKVICLFSLGFLFPPLWFWGCFLSITKRDPLALPCDYDVQYSTRRVNQWRIACAVMLGVIVLMITICAIVALTMKDLG